MAVTAKITGMEDISEMLTELEGQAEAAAAQGLYEGAGVMAAEILKGAEEIKTAPFKYAAPGQYRLPSPEEKAAVIAAGAGIARFDKNGSEVNTSVGYARSGYTELGGKTRPVPAIVNAINSGTSFMKKQPFVRKAASAGAKKAEEAIKRSIGARFDALTKK